MPIDPASGLYYELSGPNQGKPIVFLHGGGVAGWMWHNQVQEFEARYRCIVPDLPGQGKTQQAGRYSPQHAAECVAALIKSQVPGEKATVVGLSEGAQVTVALLAQAPQVVERALISSAILRPMPGSGLYTRGLFVWSYRLFMAPFKNSDWWIRANMQGQTGLGKEYFDDFKASFQSTTEASLVHMMDSAMGFRLPADLGTVNVPTLVVCGEKEYKEMKASAADLVQALPHACGALVSLGRGSSLAKEHGWALTAPELFNKTVKAWVEDQPLPAELLPLE